MPVPVFRFAPSPNGRLHLGHAFSALYGHALAKRHGGRFLVRIEDIDLSRARAEFVEAIFEDLKWLGLTWEEPVLVQSAHFPVYQAAAGKLEALGVLYPCFATRTEIAMATKPGFVDPDGAPIYPGLWKAACPDEVEERRAAGDVPAMRLDIARALKLVQEIRGTDRVTFREADESGAVQEIEARPERWGDAVIVRKDVPASYHLAVVVDDARQGVTHVTRGRDLFAATDLQRVLQILLRLPEPLYSHHRLIAGPDGRKLSKSAGAKPLGALRREGVTSADILRKLELE